MINKTNEAYKSIGEVAKILDLVNKKKGTLNTNKTNTTVMKYR